MKTILIVVALSATVGLADDSRKAESSKSAVAKDGRPEGVPAAAQLVEPGLYRYTDSKGVTWLYRRGVVGLSRWQEQSDQHIGAAERNNDSAAGAAAKQDKPDIVPAG